MCKCVQRNRLDIYFPAMVRLPTGLKENDICNDACKDKILLKWDSVCKRRTTLAGIKRLRDNTQKCEPYTKEAEDIEETEDLLLGQDDVARNQRLSKVKAVQNIKKHAEEYEEGKSLLNL